MQKTAPDPPRVDALPGEAPNGETTGGSPAGSRSVAACELVLSLDGTATWAID